MNILRAFAAAFSIAALVQVLNSIADERNGWFIASVLWNLATVCHWFANDSGGK